MLVLDQSRLDHLIVIAQVFIHSAASLLATLGGNRALSSLCKSSYGWRRAGGRESKFRTMNSVKRAGLLVLMLWSISFRNESMVDDGFILTVNQASLAGRVGEAVSSYIPLFLVTGMVS